jgi:hypothetical protein
MIGVGTKEVAAVLGASPLALQGLPACELDPATTHINRGSDGEGRACCIQETPRRPCHQIHTLSVHLRTRLARGRGEEHTWAKNQDLVDC